MSIGERFPDDKRMADETVDTHATAEVQDEDELKTRRAYKQQTGPDEDRHDETSQQASPEEERNENRKKDEGDIDEAVEESFPASDPPSYSKGLPKSE
jgi:hypothetical protein